MSGKTVNMELIEEKFKNVHDDIQEVDKKVDELEKTVKSEYAPLSETKSLDKRVVKFEDIWDWAIKIILGALLLGFLALLGLRSK